MSLIAFLAVCLTGLLLTLVLAPFARLSRLVALASLAGALVAAILMNPDDSVMLGEVQLQATWFVGFFLATLAAASLLLCTVGLVTGWPERLAPAALATMAAVGVAISSTDPTVALVAAAAATTPAALVASRVRSTPLGATVGAAELRTLALVVTASLLAAVTILNTNWNTDDVTSVLALAFLAMAGAVALRSGVFPFHVPAALLSRSGEGLGLVLSLVWIPTAFGLVALSWNASIFGVPGDWLDRAVAAVQIVAVATLILGAVGAMLHDEVEEVVVYSIVQDAGFILLALTARSADAIPPARLWLLAFVIAKSALVAWAATMSWTYGSSNLGELRGWLRRSPILALGLIAIVVATLGWPGSSVFEARSTLVDLGLPDPFHFVGTAAILLSLAYYARLLAVGVLTPTERVMRATGDRPRWPRWKRAASVTDEATEGVAAAAAETAETTPVVAARAPAAAARTLTVRAVNQVELGPVKPARDRADEEKRQSRPGPSLGHRLSVAWRLNRPLRASLLVLGTAALAAAIALGGFGSADASQSGIALDQAAGLLPDNGGQPSAEPTAEPTPEASPEVTTPPDVTPSGTTESPPPAPSAASPTATPAPSGSAPAS